MKIMKIITGTGDRINEAHFTEQFNDPQLGQFKKYFILFKIKCNGKIAAQATSALKIKRYILYVQLISFLICKRFWYLSLCALKLVAPRGILFSEYGSHNYGFIFSIFQNL